MPIAIGGNIGIGIPWGIDDRGILVGNILLETGFYFLLEDGNFILTE